MNKSSTSDAISTPAAIDHAREQAVNAQKVSLDGFADVFRNEIEEIRKRRGRAGFHPVDGDPGESLVGLALSGGGIRSATFCLGLLQGLHDLGLMRLIDYLSTVSGGGYVGGWWSAWLARKVPSSSVLDQMEDGRSKRQLLKNPVDIFPPKEQNELTRSAQHLEEKRDISRRNAVKPASRSQKPEGAQSAGIDPIHHLRLFAN